MMDRTSSIKIREAGIKDQKDVHNVHYCAFPEDERDVVAKLAVDLLLEEAMPRIISLVAETGDTILGHVAFSPIFIENEDAIQIYILAPLGIRPNFQRQGVGSQLIESGLQQLREIGVDAVLVYGDPKYYGRFGFSTEMGERFVPPYELDYPFGWQGVALHEKLKLNAPIHISVVESLSDPAMW